MIQAFQQPGMLQSVIQSGRDIDFELPDGKTALMLASEQGNASAVRQLLAAGAAPNARSRNGGTALMYAARSAATPSFGRCCSPAAPLIP